MLGGGLTMALGYQVVDAVKAKKLQVVLEDFEPPSLPIHVLYPSTRLLTAKVRAFVDLLIGSRDWRFTDF
jgi:DNA-binding transcriptional LysR family regulator